MDKNKPELLDVSPVYPRRMTATECREACEPAFDPRPVTEAEFKAELVEEFGDPEVFEDYVVPNPAASVKAAATDFDPTPLLDESGMLKSQEEIDVEFPPLDAYVNPPPLLDESGMLSDREEVSLTREAVEALVERGLATLLPGETNTVNSPSHYNHSGLEAIDAIRHALGPEGFVAYCRGNVMKYVWRAGYKGDPKECLMKAAWYCRMAAGEDPRA